MGTLPQTPLLTVDLVLFHDDAVVLIKRLREPFKDHYALPGGFVEIGETVEEACKRESLEETGLEVHSLKLVGIYSDPSRDPRRHTVSVAFIGNADLRKLRAGDDAKSVGLVRNWRKIPTAFDHKKIIADAWKLLHGQV